MSTDPDEALVLKYADDIMESLHALHNRRFVRGEGYDAAEVWAWMAEEWARDSHEWLFATVPLTSERCDCGNNGALGEDHRLSCCLMCDQAETDPDAWLSYFEMWEAVAEEITWRFSSEACYLTPDERGELDAQEEWDALTPEEQQRQLAEAT